MLPAESPLAANQSLQCELCKILSLWFDETHLSQEGPHTWYYVTLCFGVAHNSKNKLMAALFLKIDEKTLSSLCLKKVWNKTEIVHDMFKTGRGSADFISHIWKKHRMCLFPQMFLLLPGPFTSTLGHQKKNQKVWHLALTPPLSLSVTKNHFNFYS